MPALGAGERWRLVVRLKRPHGTVNPHGFDVEAWLLENGFRATGYVRDAEANGRLAAFSGRATDYVQRARAAVRARIVAALPGAPYAGVIVALAIGEERAIPEAQWRIFNRTGITHLISISGLHVTVFAALAGGLAYLLARRSTRLTTRVPAHKVAALVGIAAATLYVLLAGAQVPAMRTLVMLVVAAIGLLLSRPGTAAVVWLWSLVAVLAWDPWAGFAPGFWLSFGAVGLLLYAHAGRLRSPPPPTRAARATRGLRAAARTQMLVTIALVPGTLALFQQVSLDLTPCQRAGDPRHHVRRRAVRAPRHRHPGGAAVRGRARGVRGADGAARGAGGARRRPCGSSTRRRHGPSPSRSPAWAGWRRRAASRRAASGFSRFCRWSWSDRRRRPPERLR